ncbi:MAG: ATP-binding cassette domain-containing protein [Oscillospiraceae bacterium]
MAEIIRLEGLIKTFQTKENTVVALDGISLSIDEGEIFGIIGLSGAGKSTLVRCINLLEKPTKGKVVVDGKDLTGLSEKELLKARLSIGMIFQGFNLLSQRTALGNICYPMEIAGIPKAQGVARAKELLELVGLSDREKAYPSQLSGGQKQRVAIARALASKPRVLLCDEATSALDPNTTRSILSLLKEINRNLHITIVVITHEMAVIEKICNRVAVIDKSRIVEWGTVEEIFSAPKSDIARELILPKEKIMGELKGSRCIRLVFDGSSSFEPVISNMTLECRAAVNILFADTKNIEGRAFGQMVLQLPEDPKAVRRIFAFLSTRGIRFKEEPDHV